MIRDNDKTAKQLIWFMAMAVIIPLVKSNRQLRNKIDQLLISQIYNIVLVPSFESDNPLSFVKD